VERLTITYEFTAEYVLKEFFKVAQHLAKLRGKIDCLKHPLHRVVNSITFRLILITKFDSVIDSYTSN